MIIAKDKIKVDKLSAGQSVDKIVEENEITTGQEVKEEKSSKK